MKLPSTSYCQKNMNNTKLKYITFENVINMIIIEIFSSLSLRYFVLIYFVLQHSTKRPRGTNIYIHLHQSKFYLPNNTKQTANLPVPSVCTHRGLLQNKSSVWTGATKILKGTKKTYHLLSSSAFKHQNIDDRRRAQCWWSEKRTA